MNGDVRGEDARPFQVGDRVLVTDPGLKMLRDIMRKYGQEPQPNHHGNITEVWDDGTLLIEFDAGDASPWPPDEVRHIGRTEQAS